MFALIYTCKTHTITSFSEKLYGYYLSGIHALAFDFALFFFLLNDLNSIYTLLLPIMNETSTPTKFERNSDKINVLFYSAIVLLIRIRIVADIVNRFEAEKGIFLWAKPVRNTNFNEMEFSSSHSRPIWQPQWWAKKNFFFLIDSLTINVCVCRCMGEKKERDRGRANEKELVVFRLANIVSVCLVSTRIQSY